MSAEFDQLVARFEQFQAKLHRVDHQFDGIGQMQRELAAMEVTELITWLVMIWIPALAAVVSSFGASTAAAGAATGVRVASTGSRVARIVAKLKQFLTKILDFLRNLSKRVGNVKTAFQRSMANKQISHAMAVGMREADLPGSGSPIVKLWPG